MADHRVGHADFPAPQKENHMKNFEAALKDALGKWKSDDGDPTDVEVIFQATLSPNPGGVGQYRAIIKKQTQTFPG